MELSGHQEPITIKIQKSVFSDQPYLTTFEVQETPTSGLQYNGIEIEDFSKQISEIYEITQGWKKNLFELPFGTLQRGYL